MTTRQCLVDWQQRRCQIEVPSDFASAVMQAIAADAATRKAAARKTPIGSMLLLAAGVLLVLLSQATSMGWSLFAMAGVAQ